MADQPKPKRDPKALRKALANRGNKGELARRLAQVRKNKNKDGGK